MPVSKNKHTQSQAQIAEAMERAKQEKQRKEQAEQAQAHATQPPPQPQPQPQPQYQQPPHPQQDPHMTQNQQFHQSYGYQQPQQPQYQDPQYNTQQARPHRSFLDLNGILARPMSRHSTGEVTAQYKKKLDELMSSHFHEGFDNSFKTLVLDNNSGSVGPISAILVCYQRMKGTDRHCSVYTLLVEGSCEMLPPRNYPISGRTVVIDTVPSDVYTGSFFKKIDTHIQTIHGQKINTIDAGVMVVPRELSYEDDLHMRQIAYVATQAAYSMMERFTGITAERFNLGLINTDETTLSAKIAYTASNDFTAGQAETTTGLPVRSDIRISLIGSLNQQRHQNDLDFSPSRELVSVDGYIDLVYNQPPPPVPGQAPITQHYVPNFVITRADTQIDAITMELQLLALAQATLVSQNWAWAGSFLPNHDITGMDLRDIGAIGYEVNLAGNEGKPTKIDTKSNDFDTNALYQFILMNINKDIIYSMDIVEGGDLSWVQEVFLESSYRNEAGGSAYTHIVESANELTGGVFSQVFPAGQPIVSNAMNRVHVGYYKERDGSIKDIRNIDYLAILNLSGKNDLSTVAQWGESFDNDSIPLEVRLETRMNILKQVLSNNFTLKGYARRIMFNPIFLNALNASCYHAGLVIRPQNTFQQFSQGMSRGNYNMAQYALPSEAVQPLFTYQPQSYRPNAGIGNYQGYYSRQGY